MNIIAQPVNRLLHSDQLTAVIETLFINQPIKILRVIARTGKYFQSTSWVYLENSITGKRFSTFLSFKELLRSFWLWLGTIEIMALAIWHKISVSKVVWQYVEVGDDVWSKHHGCVKVVEKDWTEGKGIPRFWIDLGDAIAHVLPCEVDIF